MTGKTLYLTTPIYYVNDHPHIGHIYTTVMTDIFARYSRIQGWDTRFLTGTDEHGQKAQEAAEKRGITPQALADEVVQTYQNLWPNLNITHDDFIRTSEERHKKGVQKLFTTIQGRGDDIYLDHYEGLYCVPCESYYTETQAPDKLCPECKREMGVLKEESYFFRLSAYQDKLLDYYQSHPDFVQPTSRLNEVVSFVKGGLRDLSISRTTFNWEFQYPMMTNM